MKKHKVSRREFSRALGLAGGSLLVTPAVVHAGVPYPDQTEGPFYPVVEQDDKDMDLTHIEGHEGRATGDVIFVRGRVLDTDGNVLVGATVDVWQANHHGRYSHPDDTNPNPLDPDFQGWGIVDTGAAGKYGFKTIKPGPYRIGPEGTRCAHIHFKISHPDRKTLTTQMYFEGDPMIEGDLVMQNTPEDLRHLLIAKETDTEGGNPVFTWDIVLG